MVISISLQPHSGELELPIIPLHSTPRDGDTWPIPPHGMTERFYFIPLILNRDKCRLTATFFFCQQSYHQSEVIRRLDNCKHMQITSREHCLHWTERWSYVALVAISGTANINHAIKHKMLETDGKAPKHPFYSQRDRTCPQRLDDTWQARSSASKKCGRSGIVPSEWLMG